MKLIPLYIIFIAFLSSGCSSSTGSSIDKEYSKIEKRAFEIDKQMSIFNSIDNTLDDGGNMTAYYHSGVLKKIHIERDVAGGLSTRDCYFHNWRISYIADAVTMLDNPTDYSTTRNEYYFKDDKLIGWKKPGDGTIYAGGNGYKEKEKELLDDVDAYLLMIQ